MKKFTLLTTAALLATSAYAAPVSNATPRLIHSTTQSVDSKTLMRGLAANPAAPRLRDRSTAVASPSVRPLAVTSGSQEIVYDRPEGNVSNYARNCTGWEVFWGYLLTSDCVGYVQQIVEDADGDCWLSLGCTMFPLQSWCKATKEDNGDLVIAAGQAVYEEIYDGETYTYCIVPITAEVDDEGYLVYETVESMKLVYDDGTYTAEDPELILGLCEFYDGEWSWTGFGDQGITLTPVNDVVAEAPVNGTQKWAALADDLGYFVNVAFDGNTVYLGGLVETAPDAYVTGTLSDDGTTVTVKGGSFVGATDNWTWGYLYGGTIEESWDDYWEEYVYTPVPTGDLTFKYDADANRLVAENTLILTNNSGELDGLYTAGYLEGLTVVRQVRNPEAKPADPVGLEWVDYYENYGENDFNFTIPQFDTEGTLLEAENLYYRLYVDGADFILYDDEYTGVPEEGLELVPFSFTNYESVWSSGPAKTVYLFFEGADNVGVQSVYLQPVEGGEPVELCSEIVSVDCLGVKSVIADNADIVSSAYFDLQGRKVNNPAAGLYIRRDTRADGSVNAVKVAIR